MHTYILTYIDTHLHTYIEINSTFFMWKKPWVYKGPRGCREAQRVPEGPRLKTPGTQKNLWKNNRVSFVLGSHAMRPKPQREPKSEEPGDSGNPTRKH